MVQWSSYIIIISSYKDTFNQKKETIASDADGPLNLEVNSITVSDLVKVIIRS